VTSVNDLSFGEKIIVLDNDLRQLSIKTHGTQSEITNFLIKFNSTWRYFLNFSLMENIRVLSEETEFAKFLLDMEDGVLNNSNVNI